MTRLLVIVEGQTEESFVNQVLSPHLYAIGYEAVGARLMGNARMRDQRGGVRPWPEAKKDIIRHLLQDRGCHLTTMVDYYGMPAKGSSAWPGRAEANHLLNEEKARHVENALREDIAQTIGEGFDPTRFIPFVVLHEYEGLLFSDAEIFAESIGRPEMAEHFSRIRQQFLSPEDINDSPHTAPSKRIVELIPGYQKPLLGTIAANALGLTTIRTECPHFASWIETLEEIT